jgi:hypothetical protein
MLGLPMSHELNEKIGDLFDLLPQTFFEADEKGVITFTNRSGNERFKPSFPGRGTK